MTTENLMRELTLYWQKLCYFYAEFAEFVRQVIADPSMVERGDLILMGATALIVALFVLGGLIRFLNEPWKKKWESLVGLLLSLLVLAVIGFFALRRVPLPGM